MLATISLPLMCCAPQFVWATIMMSSTPSSHTAIKSERITLPKGCGHFGAGHLDDLRVAVLQPECRQQQRGEARVHAGYDGKLFVGVFVGGVAFELAALDERAVVCEDAVDGRGGRFLPIPLRFHASLLSVENIMIAHPCHVVRVQGGQLRLCPMPARSAGGFRHHAMTETMLWRDPTGCTSQMQNDRPNRAVVLQAKRQAGKAAASSAKSA